MNYNSISKVFDRTYEVLLIVIINSVSFKENTFSGTNNISFYISHMINYFNTSVLLLLLMLDHALQMKNRY